MAGSSSVDHQLLFGLLALQNGFVSREQLVSAFGKWTGDKTQPLDRVLLETGAIGDATRQALQQLVELHIHNHGGNAKHSLVAMPDSALSSVCRALGTLGDTDLDRTLMTIPNVGAADGVEAVGQTTSGSERFRVLRPLPNARGGMGVISIARDEELGRKVALKQIVEEKADSETFRQKFRLEAEVTGNLEHPGVVPVYGLGHGDDGRPYYAMRLVLGDNLAETIDAFHGNLDEGPFHMASVESDYDSVEFHGLIDRLIDVAQAVSYAHSRGVLHRDLKPANILVGEYGETLVIDWGLARLSQGDEGDQAEGSNDGDNTIDETVPHADGSSPLNIRSGSDVDATVQGQILGTVGYAPPEQLNGRVDLISERSDVYALGAILYQILTGKSPVPGPRKNDLTSRIRDTVEGKIRPPIEVCRRVPRSLNGVCVKALATSPDDRYPTAEAFIAELERWKADQPVEAVPESMLDRALRLSRRYRSAALAAAFALVGIALVSAAALVLVNGARVRESDARVRESDAREEAEQLANRNQAVVDAFVDAFRSADPQNEGVTSEISAREVLANAVNQLESGQLDDDPLAKAKLLNALGMSLNALGDFEGAGNALVLSRELFEAELGLNSVDAISAITNLALAYRYGGKIDEGLQLSQEVYQRSKTAYGEDHIATLFSLNVLANAYREAGRFDEALEYTQELYDLAKGLADVTPQMILVVTNDLALSHHHCGHLEQAIPLYEETLAMMRKELGAEHPNTLTCMANLAQAYSSADRLDQAVTMMEKAVALETEKLGRSHPHTMINMDNLTSIYNKANALEKALSLAEETLVLREEHLGEEHPDTLASLSRLAQIMNAAGQSSQALPLAEEALTRRKVVIGEEHPDIATTMQTLGLIYQAEGRTEEALEMLAGAFEMRARLLGEDHPETLNAQRTLAAARDRNESAQTRPDFKDSN